jgi:hypothetical protein
MTWANIQRVQQIKKLKSTVQCLCMGYTRVRRWPRSPSLNYNSVLTRFISSSMVVLFTQEIHAPRRRASDLKPQHDKLFQRGESYSKDIHRKHLWPGRSALQVSYPKASRTIPAIVSPRKFENAGILRHQHEESEENALSDVGTQLNSRWA